MSWIEDPAFWALSRQSMFPDSSFGAASSEIAAVFELTGLTGKGTLDVLDLPCGPGRHSLVLARAGHRVVSVDLTQSYLDEARGRIDAEAPRGSVELVREDMRRFERHGSFDLALNLFTSFGFFEDIDEDRQTLARFRRNLRPGGTLFIDTQGKEVLARIFEPKGWVRLPDGTVLLQERRVSPGWGWIDVTWTYIRDGREDSVTFGHRVYSGAELERELRESGFGDVRLLGGWDGRPYDPAAKRLMAVARA